MTDMNSNNMTSLKKGECLMEDRWNAFMAPELTVSPIENGKLNGLSFAVKDVFAVKGHTNAAGNPDWLDTHMQAQQHAASVELMLKAGAQLKGVTHTDELMYSLNGENIHYGTPKNPHSIDCIPGGSSSGSAVAVAAGCVDVALGTDTGGSVRIPSSYCGVFGFRPSHGVISMEGVIPLAPQFDTIGWMARDIKHLCNVGNVLLQDEYKDEADFETVHIANDAWKIVEDDTKITLQDHLSCLKTNHAEIKRTNIAEESLETWSNAFRLLQAREIWKTHGDWIEKVKPAFGPDIAERFEWAATIREDQEWEVANQLRVKVQQHLRELLGETGCIVMPTTPGPAPAIGRSLNEVEMTRTHTMQLSCIAGLSGLPQLTIPFINQKGKTIGLSIIAGYNQDLRLLEWAKQRFVQS